MDTKLTLNFNEDIIEKAKQYAKSNNISLSRLIEAYLAALVKKEKKHEEITPLVKSLSGVITLDKDFDYKKEYAEHLLEKYK